LYSRNKILALVVLVCLPLGLLSLPQGIQQNEISKGPVKFIISSWVFPYDEYGQGISRITIAQNSTGAWLPLSDADSGKDYDEDSSIEFSDIGASIRLTVYTWFNSTLTGAPNFTLGKNYHQHNVIVSIPNGTILFSQQNFTYGGCAPAIDPPLWYYHYVVVLNFLPERGNIYTVTVTYEVYY